MFEGRRGVNWMMVLQVRTWQTHGAARVLRVVSACSCFAEPPAGMLCAPACPAAIPPNAYLPLPLFPTLHPQSHFAKTIMAMFITLGETTLHKGRQRPAFAKAPLPLPCRAPSPCPLCPPLLCPPRRHCHGRCCGPHRLWRLLPHEEPVRRHRLPQRRVAAVPSPATALRLNWGP